MTSNDRPELFDDNTEKSGAFVAPHLVTSWDVSQALKIAGITADSVFTWISSAHSKNPILVVSEVLGRYRDFYRSKIHNSYPAYLADELVLLMPREYNLSVGRQGGALEDGNWSQMSWFCQLAWEGNDSGSEAQSLSDALAMELMKYRGVDRER